MSRDYTFAFGANPANNTGLAPTFIFFVNSAGSTISPPAISELLAGSGLYKSSYNATQMISFVLDGATTALSSSDRYITGVFDPADKFSSTLTGMGMTLGAMGSTLTQIGLSVTNQGATLVAQGATLSAIGVNLTNQGTTLVAFGGTLTSVATSTAGLGSTLNLLNLSTLANSTLIGNAGVTLNALGSTLTGVGNTLGDMVGLFGSTQSSFGSTSVDPLTVFGYLRRIQEMQEGNQVYTKASGLFALYSRGSGTTTLLRQLTVTDTVTSTTRE